MVATTHPLTRMFAGISKRLVVLIPAAMLLGLAAGLAFDLSPLKAAILPATIAMVYPMLVGFRPSEALSLKDGKAVGLAMALDFLVLPLLAWALAFAFFRGQPGLFVGMVLAGLFPTSGMTISWTGFAKGNVAAAVKMTVIGLIAASVAAPFYLLVLAGKAVPVDLIEVARTVALVVFLPMVAGVITRRTLVSRYGAQAFKSRIAPVFPGLSTVGVLVVVFIAIGLKARAIVGEPELLGVVLVPLALFYAANYAMATLLGRALLPRNDRVALVFGTVMRNLSIALGIAVTSFGPEAALVLALAYVVQVQSAAWYVRACDRMCGAMTETAPEPVAAAA